LLSDEKLVGEIKNGNEAAMEILVNRHYNTVFTYICRRIGDYHKAYDLTQDVFVRMLGGLGNVKLQEGKFANWLLKIAVNICRDYYRSSTFRQMSNSCEFDEDAGLDINVISLLERKEDIQSIKHALSLLSEEQGEAVILKYFHDRKYAEIAVITDSNESTVKSRVRQGLLKLKEILLKEDNDEGRNFQGRNG